MASLQSRISDLITAIGADIKALQAASPGTKDRYNASQANQTLSANVENSIAGSVVSIPQGKIQIGTVYRCSFDVAKTAAGTAAPIVVVKVGPNGGIADTARCTINMSAQTGVADEGKIEIECAFRVAGASAILQMVERLWHRLVTTGLSVTAVFTQFRVTSAAFDVTGTPLFISVVVNPGASAAWTVSMCSAELVNLAP